MEQLKTVTCRYCKGTGTYMENACINCDGTGRIVIHENSEEAE